MFTSEIKAGANGYTARLLDCDGDEVWWRTGIRSLAEAKLMCREAGEVLEGLDDSDFPTPSPSPLHGEGEGEAGLCPCCGEMTRVVFVQPALVPGRGALLMTHCLNARCEEYYHTVCVERVGA